MFNRPVQGGGGGVPGPGGGFYGQTIGGSTHGRCWRLQYSRPVLNPFSTRLNLYKSTGRTAVGPYTHNSRGLGLTVLSPWLFLFYFVAFHWDEGAQGGRKCFSYLWRPGLPARPLKYIFCSLQCSLDVYNEKKKLPAVLSLLGRFSGGHKKSYYYKFLR